MPTIGCGHWNGRRNRLPHLVDQSFGEVGGAGGFDCRWKLISIAHPNPENGYAPCTPCRRRRPAKRSTDPERSAAGLALAVSRWPGRAFALTSTRSVAIVAFTKRRLSF